MKNIQTIAMANLTVPVAGQGMRLDAALAFGFPEMGIRGRRRLWQSACIYVNGIPQAPGFIVSHNDMICVEPLAATDEETFSAHDISLLHCTHDFAVFCKPANMHTANIAGNPHASFEALLPELWQKYEQETVLPSHSPPALLTRLDFVTSGLILGAFSATAEARFRMWEKQGRVQKTYWAVVEGILEQPLVIDSLLDTANRAKTRVHPTIEADITRHTHAAPLHAWQDGRTLVQIRIARGARHQIRAHLASVGFPIVGDTLYGLAKAGDMFYLHYGAVSMPELEACCPAPWLP